MIDQAKGSAADRLYELLPVVYRQRDAEQGYPLRALLGVIAEQVNVVEADIERLYENWFIETCEDWVVPYIGDLVGYRAVHEAGQPGEATASRGQLRNRILIPRREVANTVRYRRRKGTLALLELLAADVAGWPARVVEFYKLLGWTQALNHLRLDRGRTVDLRYGEALERLDGPFDQIAHTIDVRRISSTLRQGRYNIPSVGLFVWRLRSYPVTQAQAYRLEHGDDLRYTFSVLQNNVPLHTRAVPEAEPTDVAGELNVPAPIRRRAFEACPGNYYGPGKSLQIWTGASPDPVSLDTIVVSDLSDWERYRCGEGQVAVDPELGRILFHPSVLRAHNVKVWVSYHYGFGADLGGGEYERPLSPAAADKIVRVGRGQDVKLIDAAWNEIKEFFRDRGSAEPVTAVLEICDSRVYSEQINIELKENQTLHIRAANLTRPIIRQLDYNPSLPDAFTVTGEAGSKFSLDGLLITGRPVRISGPLQEVAFRHTTLVPGWTLQPDCEPDRGLEPSLQLYDTPGTRVTIEHSILGTIQVKLDEVEEEPIPIYIADSILDATGPEIEALGTPEWRLGVKRRRLAHAVLTIVRSTVFGYVDVHAIDLAENTIFDGLVTVGRRQRGCMRFCYAPWPDSRTPRRFNCQPELARRAIAEEIQAQARAEGEPTPTKDELKAAQDRESERVRPRFSSRRYGVPTYAQLAATCAEEITRGADDESEIGVYHDLYRPQRTANLLARLQEYTPAGMDVGIIYVS